jgi:predicted DCC family thiol-disulfide oxidoreductase YuxK
MPPYVLLAAKLMAVFCLARALFRDGPYAEMLSGSVAPPATLVLLGLWVLFQLLGPLAAVLLLFNRAVRGMSFILGLSLAVGLVLPHSGGDLFLAAFLILASLQSNTRAPVLLRCLIVFAYLAVGLGWAVAVAGFGGIRWDVVPTSPAAAFEPPAWAGALTLVLLGAGLAVRRLRSFAIWIGIVFHCAYRDISGPLGAYTMLASYLAFADWPQDRLTVLYDGDCGFCNKTREWISRFDLERLYDWKPYQSGAGAAFGISREALEQRAYVVSPRGIDSGFQAFRTMALYNPLTYFGLAAVAIALHAAMPLVQNIVLAALILAFSPLVRPIGEMAYDWVARNRHRLPPRGCKIPE